MALIAVTAYRQWGRGSEGRSRSWAIVLTAYWGFAFSAQFVVPPPRVSPVKSPIIIGVCLSPARQGPRRPSCP